MSEAEAVGSVGEEALRLLRALGSHTGSDSTGSDSTVSDSTGSEAMEPVADTAEPHACPTGWCPICQVVGFVRDNPDAIAQVAASAGSMLHALRGLVEAAVTPKEHP